MAFASQCPVSIENPDNGEITIGEVVNLWYGDGKKSYIVAYTIGGNQMCIKLSNHLVKSISNSVLKEQRKIPLQTRASRKSAVAKVAVMLPTMSSAASFSVAVMEAINHIAAVTVQRSCRTTPPTGGL